MDGGGALMNQGIHSVDTLLWLMGQVRAVTAQTATRVHRQIAVEDTAVATLQFSNGALGVVQATTAAYPGFVERIEILGSEGSAVIVGQDLREWHFSQPITKDKAIRSCLSAQARFTGGVDDPASIDHIGHTKYLANVINSIKQGQTPAVDAVEGRRSVEAILAIYAAARDHQLIQIPL
jgi:predicted dehydrogenase